MQKIIFIFIASSSLLYSAEPNDSGYETDTSSSSSELVSSPKRVKIWVPETDDESSDTSVPGTPQFRIPSTPPPTPSQPVTALFAQLAIKPSAFKPFNHTIGQKRAIDPLYCDEEVPSSDDEVTQLPQDLLERAGRALRRVEDIQRALVGYQHSISQLEKQQDQLMARIRALLAEIKQKKPN